MSNLAAKCGRVRQPHSCGHETIRYSFCNSGRHVNEYYANKLCYEMPGHPPPVTQIAGQLPWCSGFCRAKLAGWLCCQCPLVVSKTTGLNERQFVTGTHTGNQIWHHPINGQQHILCAYCTFPVCPFTCNTNSSDVHFVLVLLGSFCCIN